MLKPSKQFLYLLSSCSQQTSPLHWRLSGVPRCMGRSDGKRNALCNLKLHAARVRVCVGLLADCRVAATVSKQPLLQVGVVGADMDKGVFLVKPNIGGLFLLGKPCSHKLSFLRPCYAIGAFFGCFLRLLTWGKRRFSNRSAPDDVCPV